MGVNSNQMYYDGSSWMNLFDFNLYGDPAISIVSSFSYQCPDCPADGVITNAIYRKGTTCICTNATAIRLGSNVTVESGATVTFTAPKVNIQPGFHAENGSTVNIKQ